MNIKKQFGLYKNIEQYKKEILIPSRLSEQELNQLHVNCNCFISTSHGEAWCRPALDALGFGKTPIVTDNTGMIDFINDSNGWVVKSHKTPVLAMNKPLAYLYTSRETWYNIDILELQRAMREAYENKALRIKKSAQGIRDIQNYSYAAIGQKLLGRLNNEYNQ